MLNLLVLASGLGCWGFGCLGSGFALASGFPVWLLDNFVTAFLLIPLIGHLASGNGAH